MTMSFVVKLLALQVFFTTGIASTSYGENIGKFANTTVRPISGRLDDLLSLSPRQFQCEFPGGPQCSATTCCRPGERCCALGCCDTSDNCFGTTKCCPKIAETCGGKTCCEPGTVCCTNSPTGCCAAGATCCKSSTTPCCPSGSTCCGNTCCLSGYTCERNECVNSNALNSGKVARFQYDQKKNGCLLVNMCNGMRGKNTIELTYSGKLSKSAKAAKRRQAGCVKGYCAKLGLPGLNSCDEFPPASSDEGGNTLPTIERAINCIPGIQNSLQGNIFSQMVRSSKIQAGDTFVISIDCDEVLGAGTSPCDSRVPRSEPVMEGIAEVMKRDDIQISNSTTLDSFYNSTLSGMDTGSVIILPFTDLGPGQYSASIEVITGSISGSVILDNLGDDYADGVGAAQLGQSQQLSFSIEDGGELMGVGMVMTTNDSSTRVKWAFQGQDLPAQSSNGGGSTSGDGSSDDNSGGSNGASRMITSSWMSIAAVGGVVLLIRLATY